jgi:hypothetical protein
MDDVWTIIERRIAIRLEELEDDLTSRFWERWKPVLFTMPPEELQPLADELQGCPAVNAAHRAIVRAISAYRNAQRAEEEAAFNARFPDLARVEMSCR